MSDIKRIVNVNIPVMITIPKENRLYKMCLSVSEDVIDKTVSNLLFNSEYIDDALEKLCARTGNERHPADAIKLEVAR